MDRKTNSQREALALLSLLLAAQLGGPPATRALDFDRHGRIVSADQAAPWGPFHEGDPPLSNPLCGEV